jgi:hypothetical protein
VTEQTCCGSGRVEELGHRVVRMEDEARWGSGRRANSCDDKRAGESGRTCHIGEVDGGETRRMNNKR